jgi:hypothetical protein
VYTELVWDGAKPGADFDLSDLNSRAALAMIGDSPLGQVVRYSDYDSLADNTRFLTPQKAPFTAASTHKSAGKFNDAVVLAARADAMLSPTETWELMAAISPFGENNLLDKVKRITAMGRAFDTEHAKSVTILNDFVEGVAHAAHVPARLFRKLYDPSIDTARRISCLAAFAHGARVTERLITGGQYIKAAASLKQDYELLPRMLEAQAGRLQSCSTPGDI